MYVYYIMPILGDRDSLDILRQKQYNEIVNEDQHIYRQVFEREKKQNSNFDQTVTPQNTLLNQDIILLFNKNIEAFAKKLEEVNNLLTIAISGGQKTLADKFKDITESYDSVIYYNNMVRAIQDPALNHITRSQMIVQVLKILPFIDSVKYNYKNMIVSILNSINVGAKHSLVTGASGVIPALISAYSLYSLMYKNIDDRKFKIIEMDEIKSEFGQIVKNEFPSVREMEIIQKNLKQDDSSLLEQQYKLYEEEFGEKPSEAKKLQLAKKLNLNAFYNPVFTDKINIALNSQLDARNEILKGKKQLKADLEDEIDDTIARRNLGDEDYQEESDRLNEELKKLKRLKPRGDEEKQNKLSNIEKIKKEIELLNKPNEDMRQQFLENEFDARKGNGKKKGNGNMKKIYLRRQKNDQMEYNDAQNESYAY